MHNNKERVDTYKHCKHEFHLYNQNIHGCNLTEGIDLSLCGENCPHRDEEVITTITTYSTTFGDKTNEFSQR